MTCGDTCEVTLAELVEDRLRELIDIDAIVDQLGDENPDLADVDEDGVRQRFAEDPTESWRMVASRFVDDNIEGAVIPCAN